MNETTPLPTEITGVILCGGESSRMGYAKANLPFGDRSLLRRMIARLQVAGLQTIVLAAADGQQLPEDVPADAQVVRDATPRLGPLEALRGGLRAAAAFGQSAFVTSCDAPFLEPRLIRRLFELFPGYEIVVPIEDRFAHPLTAIYRCELAQRIDALIRNNQMRPRHLIDQSRSRKVDTQQLREVDPELKSFINMNRPTDYLNALAMEGLTAPPEILRAWADAKSG